jgi:hypothetical protein
MKGASFTGLAGRSDLNDGSGLARRQIWAAPKSELPRSRLIIGPRK